MYLSSHIYLSNDPPFTSNIKREDKVSISLIHNKLHLADSHKKHLTEGCNWNRIWIFYAGRLENHYSHVKQVII